MDLICDALDAFNRAGKLSQLAKDTELEAISEAWLGKILYKGLKKNSKARAHLYDCMLLCNTLYPKIVIEEAWYQLAAKYL
jgi:hypothetical protein